MLHDVIAFGTGLLVALAIGLFVACLALKLREFGFDLLLEPRKVINRPWFERALLLFFICGMVQYAATKGTGNGGRSSGSETRDSPVEETEGTTSRTGNSQETGEVTNLCFAGITVLTSGIELSVAWPTNFFTEGTTLDFFARCNSLTNAWQWFACCPISSGMTNVTVMADWQDDLGCITNPPSMFFRIQDRMTCANTMSDTDCDGLPDVYELHNGMNPYVNDYVLAPKLTVGADGDYKALAAALSASTNYSIVEISSESELLHHAVVLPSHPVLITGPPNGYARLYSSANIAAFLLNAGQCSETVLRNLCVVLTARSNFQSAFWIGGNLPWSGIGASPTFENIRVRALYPNVLHYGWHYYRDNQGFSQVSNCVMNAAGSTSAIGIYSYDGPNVGISDCAVINFPTNDGDYASWIKDGTNIVAVLPHVDTNLSWAGYPLNETYSSTTDSDGDGISDYDEIRVHDTDPWLPDSDGDGLTDAEEIDAGTNPRDLYSFYRHITVITTATDNLADTTNYVAWGTSSVGWETNDISSCWTLPATNTFIVMSTNGPMYVKSYRDLNRNGQYDPETDIILIQQVPSLDAVSTFILQFGDVDGDGISDDMERQHGADPYNKLSRCFSMSLTIDDIPYVTNALTAKVLFEGVEIWGPNAVTGTVLAVDLGHLISTNGESVMLTFWDDSDGDSTVGTNEWSATMSFSPTGHENAIEQLAKSTFDRDNDGMPDYWETLHADAGLSPTNAADALLDPDGDGLINYHEYWAGCNPAGPDGSNTLISVCSRSVDDRIRNIVPSNTVDRFVNFFENGSNGVFVANTNFWLKDVDVSCVSVWNDGEERGSMAAMAITRRHVVMAAHWHTNPYYFCTTNGQVVMRWIRTTYQIAGSDMLLGRLDADLPASIHLPKILSTNLVDSIANCKYLPSVCMNNHKAATILELDSLNCTVTASGGATYHQMGKTSGGNVVSIERAAVWNATPVGNSSSPVFLLAGNELIFLFSKHLGYKSEGASKANWGLMISYRSTEVQDKINEWEGVNANAYQINILQNFDVHY